MEMHDGQALLSLEDVKPPPLFRFPSLGGLAVLDHHAIEDVGVAHQGPRQAHLNLKVHMMRCKERTHTVELLTLGLFSILVSRRVFFALLLKVHTIAKWTFRNLDFRQNP